MTETYESFKFSPAIACVLAGLLGLCGFAHADSPQTGSKARVGASPSHPEVEGLRMKAHEDAQSRVDAEATAALPRRNMLSKRSAKRIRRTRWRPSNVQPARSMSCLRETTRPR
jgi:hypothetical protein